MQTKIYTLPEWDFVGGETQRRSFTLVRESGTEYDLPSALAKLAVVNFVNPHSELQIEKEVNVVTNEDGMYCEVTFVLDPADTVNMSGKYIYQITIKDDSGTTSIPHRGYMYVTENIDKDFAV